MPDIEAYRDAVSGRALNLKCRGGQSVFVEIPQGYWRFNYWSAVVGTTPTTWPGNTFYSIPGFREGIIGGPIPSVAAMLQSPGPHAIYFPSMDLDEDSIDPVTFEPLSRWDLQAVNANGDVTGSLRFSVNAFRGAGTRTLTGYELIWVVLAPERTFGTGRAASNADEIRLSAADDSTGDMTEPETSPGFDFWARLDAGAGSILDDGIDVQTVELICRYDSRHLIGEYIGLPDDLDYNYIVTEIDYIGRQKWQVLTCKRLRIPG